MDRQPRFLIARRRKEQTLKGFAFLASINHLLPAGCTIQLVAPEESLLLERRLSEKIKAARDKEQLLRRSDLRGVALRQADTIWTHISINVAIPFYRGTSRFRLPLVREILNS